MKLGLGLGLSSRRYGGAAAYHADAVHFDGANSSLAIAALSCTDSALVSFSFWFKFATSQEGLSIYAVDPAGDYATYCAIASDKVKFSFYDSAVAKRLLVGDSLEITNDAWHHLMGSIKTDLSAGNKLKKIYFDDIDLTEVIDDSAASFVPAFNGKPFFFGDEGGNGGVVADIAEPWIAVGQTLLTVNDITEATRRKFISATGKPVNLGADGSTPTGTAPTIFFSGDSTAFATNRGTGGAFTLTGSLTNASTSPSD